MTKKYILRDQIPNDMKMALFILAKNIVVNKKASRKLDRFSLLKIIYLFCLTSL